MIYAIVLIVQTCSVEDVATRFRQLGYEATVVAPGSLMISADEDQFSTTFDVTLKSDRDSGTRSVSNRRESRALPHERLPEPLRGCISAIEFEEPIEFGPPSY